MGLLDSLAGSRDPSGNWATEPGLALDFDFEPPTLLGVTLGEPVEKLFRLGPAENKETAHEGELRYYSRGVAIEVVKGKCDAFFIVFSQGLEGYAAFHGAIRFKGTPISMSNATETDMLIDIFGEPLRREDDEDETVLYFSEVNGIDWEIEFSPLGLLRCITVRRGEP
jgi:hypothetical protein